jgi:hypothetical protein
MNMVVTSGTTWCLSQLVKPQASMYADRVQQTLTTCSTTGIVEYLAVDLVRQVESIDPELAEAMTTTAGSIKCHRT